MTPRTAIARSGRRSRRTRMRTQTVRGFGAMDVRSHLPRRPGRSLERLGVALEATAAAVDLEPHAAAARGALHAPAGRELVDEAQAEARGLVPDLRVEARAVVGDLHADVVV